MTEEAPSIAVIIPAYNPGPLLGAQLEALTAQSGAPRFQVIVADNGSTDATPQIVAEYAKKLDLSIVDASAKRGVGYARNTAVEQTDTAIVAFCDSDDVARPDWVRAMVAAVVTSGGALVAGGLSHARINDPDVLFAYGLHDEEASDANPMSYGPPSRYAGYLPSVCGANFALLRDDYLRIGGMDTAFSGGAEDTDFAWRAQLAGIKIIESPEARIDYRLRTTPGAIFRQQRLRHIAKVRLWSIYGQSGMIGPSWRASASSLSREVLCFPRRGRTRRGRMRSAYLIGAYIGAVQGMLQYRVMPRLRRSRAS